MSVRVWKFAVPPPTATGSVWLDVPADARLLSVGLQGYALVVWALVDAHYDPPPPMDAPGPRRLIVANTGQDIPDFPEGARFLGTVTASNGIVWHVWEGEAA